MRNKIWVFVLGGLAILWFRADTFANELSWQDVSRGNVNIKTVLIHPDNPKIIYMGSSRGIFISEDRADTWRSILSVRGENKNVNFILLDPWDKNSLYAATAAGLFYSKDMGRNWKRIFQGKGYLEAECNTLVILPQGIYLGTSAGLFISRDKGRSWHKEMGDIGKGHVLAIAYNVNMPEYIYIACIEGVFKSEDNGQHWDKIFVASVTDKNGETDQGLEDQDEGARSSNIRYLAVDINNPDCLYLATSTGVYKSNNRGKDWQAISNYGLLSQDVKFVYLSKSSKLYALTRFGVFEYEDNRWQELSFGLAVTQTRFLALDNQGSLYVACDRGLFRANIKDVSCGLNGVMDLYYKNEPRIEEVQKVAIKYAEVSPDKIIKWRKQAAKKAWLPQVSVGLDRDTNDLWHWETGSTTKEDDILKKGNDSIDWDVNLSWDLGDIIFNDAQTSIDTRSRLMVQLRDDILDEVTKLYYERLRVKIELDNISIEDRNKRFDRELRIQELTASIDALTGGFFSRQLHKGPS